MGGFIKASAMESWRSSCYRFEMDHRIFSLPLWRVIAAFAVTPLVAAFALACIQPLYAGLPSTPERIYRTATVYALLGRVPSRYCSEGCLRS
jgi:hypothetical protein